MITVITIFLSGTLRNSRHVFLTLREVSGGMIGLASSSAINFSKL